MAKIAQSLVELIGKTPLLELSKVEKKQRLKARVLVKLEYLNPGRSVKDRVGYALIEQAEKQGLLGRNTVIIEPTSGNTGVGLALVAARRGYKLILTMPDSMSIERRTLLRSLGARSVISLDIPGIPAPQVGQLLDKEGIAVRAGHHCAQPALRALGYEMSVRPTFAVYNTKDEVDRLVVALQRIVADVEK